MKNKSFTILCFLFSILSSCQQKKPHPLQQNFKKDNQLRCKTFFRIYQEKFIREENDSAAFYIDKAIECDPKNVQFLYARVLFNVSTHNYNNAIAELEKINSLKYDINKELFIAILKFRIHDSDAENLLKNIYVKFSENKKITSDAIIYKVALDNFFKGKDFALNQIQLYKQTYNSDYDIQNINAIENLIKTVEKDKVLFDVFNIKD